MKDYINIFQDRVAFITTISAGVLFFICLVSIGLFYRQLPPFLPLYNRMAWGYARLGNTYEIFIPLALAVGFVILNLWYSKKLQSVSPLLTRFLFFVNLLLAVFTAIFLLKLIFIIV